MLIRSRRRAAAAVRSAIENPPVRIVALTGGEQRHVYLFREDRADACLARIAAHAADGEHPLTAGDAELLRERVLED